MIYLHSVYVTPDPCLGHLLQNAHRVGGGGDRWVCWSLLVITLLLSLSVAVKGIVSLWHAEEFLF